MGDNGWLAGNGQDEDPGESVPQLAVGAGGTGAAGGDVCRVAAPPGGAEECPAPVRVDGHAGVDGHQAACSWSVYATFFFNRDKSGTSGLDQVLHGSGGGIYLEVAASVTTFQLAGRLYEAEAGAKDVRALDDDGTAASSRGAAADGTAVRGPAR